MSLHRLLGFDAAVREPAALGAFYGEMGLIGDDVAGWAGSDGGAVVRVDESHTRRLLRVELGCDDDSDLAVVAARLDDGGGTCRVASDSVRVIDDASRVEFVVRVAAPEVRRTSAVPIVPNAPGHAVRIDERAPAVFERGRAPRRLGHLVVATPDLATTRALLVDGLGFKVSDEIDGFIHFLRCSTDHHNVALVHASVPFLQHYSWECDDIDHVGHAATALLGPDRGRHVWGLGRHFAGSNFYWYLRDPAGSFVEFYADLDQIHDDEAWERRGRTAFDLTHIANAWGPDLPPEFVVPSDLAELERAWVER